MATGGDNTGPNSRVVDVMNFLAAHPTESFTLSELASYLGLSNGSAHRLLTTLAEARFLSRHPKRKTYSLGMALVAIGQAALASHRDVDIARREMVRLGKELKVQCHAMAVVHDELLFLACEGTPQSYVPPSRVGERRPFIPPMGMGHVAWAGPEAVEEYLSRAPAALSDRARRHLARSLEVMRKRGYGVAGNGPVLRALRQFTCQPVGYHGDEGYWAGLRQLVADLSNNEIQLLDLDDIGSEGVSYITVPVFGPSGEVVLELSISGMRADLTRAEIERYIERVLAAAAIITSETHGRLPQVGAGAEVKGRERPGKARSGKPAEGKRRKVAA